MKFGLFDHTGGDRSMVALVAVIDDANDDWANPNHWAHAANRRFCRIRAPWRWLPEGVAVVVKKLEPGWVPPVSPFVELPPWVRFLIDGKVV